MNVFARPTERDSKSDVISPHGASVKTTVPRTIVVVVTNLSPSDSFYVVCGSTIRPIRRATWADSRKGVQASTVYVRGDFQWLSSVRLSSPVSVVSRDYLLGPLSSSIDVRDAISSWAIGTGLEFGAASSPFPIPIGSSVLYADRFDTNHLKQVAYTGQESSSIRCIDYVVDIQDIPASLWSTFDFIIACHVIEHTSNPGLALINMMWALRAGARCILVVPEMTKTFDRKRSVTSIEHLITDFVNPNVDRDLEHYVDFFSLAFPKPEEVSIWDYAKNQFDLKTDIHYHAFTYKSFMAFLQKMRKYCSFEIEYSHACLNHPSDIEFYVVLRKIG